jgi:ABC-2 type transport system permease protein
MQVFNTYFKIMKKQMLSIAIYAIIFLALTVAITKSIKVENQQFMTDKVKTMVVNKDGENEFIEGFLNYLGQYVVFVEPKEKEEDRKDALFFREAVYILTIPEGFTDKFLTDGSVHLQKETVPDSIEAISVDNAINNYLNTAKVYSKYLPDMDYGEINTHIANSLGEQTPVTVDVKETDELTYSNGFNMNYFNYLAYVMISCFTTGVSIVMFSFHGLDIRRRHSASPLTSRNMNLQLVFANLMYVLAYMVVFIIAGYILNRDRMVNMNAWLTWLNAVIFALTVLSISYLVGITVKSRRAVQAISTALSLSLSFISGIFVPQQYLAAPVLKVASFTPTFWYVKANTAIEGVKSLGWSELSDIVGYMAIQLGFAAAIISVALVVSKRKRQQAY